MLAHDGRFLSKVMQFISLVVWARHNPLACQSLMFNAEIISNNWLRYCLHELPTIQQWFTKVMYVDFFTHPHDFCTQTRQEKSRIKRYVSDLLEGTSVPPSQATKAYGRSSSGVFTFDECNAIAASVPGVALAFPLFFLCRVSTRALLFFWLNDLVVPNFYSMRHAIFLRRNPCLVKVFFATNLFPNQIRNVSSSKATEALRILRILSGCGWRVQSHSDQSSCSCTIVDTGDQDLHWLVVWVTAFAAGEG